MSSDAVVEDLRISALPLAETAALICRNAGSVAAQNVFTLNLDHVVKMRKDAMFRGAYQAGRVDHGRWLSHRPGLQPPRQAR